MSLRIRAIRLEVMTDAGPFERVVEFQDGLNVLHASNSSGKSTLLQAIVFALGLEGMFGPSHDIPLPHVMTDWLENEEGRKLAVIESAVLVEIANQSDERLTVRRQVVGSDDRHLIRTFLGPALTQATRSFSSRDYFVRRPGSATHEAGFHHALADFADFAVPSVSRFDGREGPLYLEAVWPLLFVEQKIGYTAIEGRFPGHLRIREVGMRAVEFLLGLDAVDVAARRGAHAERERELRVRWQGALDKARASARLAGAIIQNLSTSPVSEWPPSPAIALVVPEGDGWLPLDEPIRRLEQRLTEIRKKPIATTQEALPTTIDELRARQDELSAIDRAMRELGNALEDEHEELAAAEQQLEALDVDLVRMKDAATLTELGSVQALDVYSGLCPTCRQDVGASVALFTQPKSEVMNLDVNIEFLKQQRRLYEFMALQAQQAVEARERQVSSVRERAGQLRAAIRSIKEALTSDPRLPSVAEIESRVRLEKTLQDLERSRRDTMEALNAFSTIAEDWRQHLVAGAQLPTDRLTSEDQKKLRLFEQSLQGQLREYGLSSVDIDGIQVSTDTYRVTYGGLELQFDLSGSDLIRTVWAYRLALMETAEQTPSEHPGLLILDEPRQQATAAESFKAFLERLSAQPSKRQVIVSMSESLASLGIHLNPSQHTLLEVRGRMLKPAGTI